MRRRASAVALTAALFAAPAAAEFKQAPASPDAADRSMAREIYDGLDETSKQAFWIVALCGGIFLLARFSGRRKGDGGGTDGGGSSEWGDGGGCGGDGGD